MPNAVWGFKLLSGDDGDTVLYFMPFRGNGDSGKKQVEPNIW